MNNHETYFVRDNSKTIIFCVSKLNATRNFIAYIFKLRSVQSSVKTLLKICTDSDMI